MAIALKPPRCPVAQSCNDFQGLLQGPSRLDTAWIKSVPWLVACAPGQRLLCNWHETVPGAARVAGRHQVCQTANSSANVQTEETNGCGMHRNCPVHKKALSLSSP
jgi:hypothetical protein